MPDILDNTLNFYNEESWEGCCPICESSDLEYYTCEVVDTCVIYPWTCNTCGTEGKEVCVIEFDGHDIIRGSLSSQIEALYCDGGLRPKADIDEERGGENLDYVPLPMLLEGGKYYIFQLNRDAEYDHLRGVGYKYYEKTSEKCSIYDYELIYTGTLEGECSPEEHCGQISDIFTCVPPSDFYGSPFFTGDIVIVTPGNEAHAFFYEGVNSNVKIDYILEQVASNIELPGSNTAVKILVPKEEPMRNYQQPEKPTEKSKKKRDNEAR